VDKLKVLILNYEFPPIGGGAGRATLCILKEYATCKEIEVDVLTSADNPGIFKEQFAENITIHKVGVHKKDLHFWRKVEVIEWLIKAGTYYRRLLRRNDYDLAHAFFGFPTGWLCYRSRDKLPYMISLRGSDVPGENPRLKLDYTLLGPVFRKIWSKAAVLVACSKGLKDRALMFMPSSRIEVISNGIDSNRFFAGGAYERGAVLELLTVGRLSATKRVEMLIDAVERLNNEGHKVRLRVAGGGAMAEQLKRMVSEKGLDGIVELIGRVEAAQMPGIYRSSDIYVSATMQEGMSNAMLEAMASGLPIVTTVCEGLEELISDNGTVVDAQPETIAAAIKELAGNPEFYKQTSDAAVRQAEKFSWKAVAAEYLNTYVRIAGKAI